MNLKLPRSVMMMNMQAVNFFCHSLGERRRRARQSVRDDWIRCCRRAKPAEVNDAGKDKSAANETWERQTTWVTEEITKQGETSSK